MPTEPRPQDGARGVLELVADIGGTHARFALTEEHTGRWGPVRVMLCADFPTLEAAIRHYLSDVGGSMPRRARLAVAAPVTGDRVSMPNHPWSFSLEELRERLGFEVLRAVNDFTALAMALPHLTPGQRRSVGGGAAVAGAPIGLIGPGTGLGISGLVPHAGGWIPLASEGGHVTYGPTTPREAEIVAVIRKQYGHVSAERLVSGPGLVNLYRAVSELAGSSPEHLVPAEVTERARQGTCDHCQEARGIFCAVLGTVAGNLALTLGARGGVYIGGGIVPRLESDFDGSAFRDRFEDKGRYRDYLAQVPTYVITAEHPALLGLARISHQAALDDQTNE